jgi:hypothetical protein
MTPKPVLEPVTRVLSRNCAYSSAKAAFAVAVSSKTVTPVNWELGNSISRFCSQEKRNKDIPNKIMDALIFIKGREQL